jgi:DNA polymerase-3 subunit epsilon
VDKFERARALEEAPAMLSRGRPALIPTAMAGGGGIDLSRTTGRAMNFVAIDFETASYQRNSACSVGLVKVVENRIVDKVVHLIRPPTKEFVFTYIHGLSWKDVEKSLDFGSLWPAIDSFICGADFLAAHNASFDKGVLYACCASYGITPPTTPFRCSMQISRRSWNIYPTKLSDVCRELGIPLNHHEALSDALACAQIVISANRP